MLRLVFAVVISAQVLSGSAQAQAEREHDPRFMTRTEVQMLQDAMIWVSSYGSLKDEGWGRLASEANRNWRRENNLRQSDTFTEAELTLLFQQAVRAREAVGWTMAYEPHTGIWLGYPARYVQPGERRIPSLGARATDFRGPDDAVFITALRNSMDIAGIRGLMTLFAGMDGVAKVNYRLDREHRQVVSADLHNGSTIYVRFDRYGAEWRGFLLRVQGGKVDVGRMIVAVSAEFSPTGSPPVENPTDAPVIGPILARIVGRGAAPPSSSLPAPIARLAPAPSPAALPPAPATQAALPALDVPATGLEPGRLSGSGTAFVVRRDGLFLTNEHVVADCTRLALADGTRLEVVAADKRRDLALLRAAHLSTPEIVRFRRDATVDLGEGVSLFGFPLYRAISTSMNLTNGIVTSLAGLGDDPMHFQINAALQPGNSGGPLLDEAGLLIGVAVAHLNDRVVMSETGSLPQTMNYAIRGAVADSFLLENGLLAEKAPSQSKADLRDIARLMQAAVRPVLCYR